MNHFHSPVVALNRDHLIGLIEEHIATYGIDCSLTHIDVRKVRDMTRVFAFKKFNGDISNWDVSNVLSMQEMFASNESFNGDLSQWNVAKVEIMSFMFSKACAFNSDLSQWNVSNVTLMSDMFKNAKSFNGDLSQWNVSRVVRAIDMFSGAALFKGDLSKWDFASVRDISDMSGFFSREPLDTLMQPNVSVWFLALIDNLALKNEWQTHIDKVSPVLTTLHTDPLKMAYACQTFWEQSHSVSPLESIVMMDFNT